MRSWVVNGQDIVNDRTYASASTRFLNEKIFDYGSPPTAKVTEVSEAKVSRAIFGVYKRDRIG